MDAKDVPEIVQIRIMDTLFTLKLRIEEIEGRYMGKPKSHFTACYNQLQDGIEVHMFHFESADTSDAAKLKLYEYMKEKIVT